MNNDHPVTIASNLLDGDFAAHEPDQNRRSAQGNGRVMSAFGLTRDVDDLALTAGAMTIEGGRKGPALPQTPKENMCRGQAFCLAASAAAAASGDIGRIRLGNSIGTRAA
jgi:hypothetical protein